MPRRDEYDDYHRDDNYDDDRRDDRRNDRPEPRDRDPNNYDDVAEPTPRGERLRRRAMDRLSLPGIFLAVLGLVSLLISAATVGVLAVSPETMTDPQYQAIKDVFPNQPMPPKEEYAKEAQVQGIAINAVRIIADILMILGAIKMRSLRGYSLAIVASIIAIIPLCPNECCCALPFGIWALVVLLSADVKRAFSLVPRPESY